MSNKFLSVLIAVHVIVVFCIGLSLCEDNPYPTNSSTNIILGMLYQEYFEAQTEFEHIFLSELIHDLEDNGFNDIEEYADRIEEIYKKLIIKHLDFEESMRAREFTLAHYEYNG